MQQQQITPSTVEELAGLAGLPLDPSRQPMLAAVLQQLVDGVRAMDALELEPVEPALVFSARWEEE